MAKTRTVSIGEVTWVGDEIVRRHVDEEVTIHNPSQHGRPIGGVGGIAFIVGDSGIFNAEIMLAASRSDELMMAVISGPWYERSNGGSLGLCHRRTMPSGLLLRVVLNGRSFSVSMFFLKVGSTSSRSLKVGESPILRYDVLSLSSGRY